MQLDVNIEWVYISLFTKYLDGIVVGQCPGEYDDWACVRT